MITAVTSPDVVVELRPPLLSLVLYAASLVFMAVMVVVFVRDFSGDAFSAIFLVFVAGILGFNTATVFSRARAHADGSLVVRNRFATRRLQRSDVDRVIVGRQGGFGSPRRLELLLTDGATLPLVATEVPPLPGLRQRLDDQAGQLRAWATGTQAPFLS
jgi:hypothetical protein